MAVLLDTSLGEIVIDLHTDLCPLTCKNFLKLCKIKYYNNCIFHDVKKDFIAQTGDPTGTGAGGDSLYKHLYGEQARFFDDEIHPKLTHEKIGTVAMASAGENLNASQFYITLRAGLDYLDGKHTVFGEVAEGLETLMRINDAYVDEKGRPYKNIRIKHVSIVDDPFDDPPALADLIPDKSPEIKPPAEGEEVRLEDDWVPMDELMDPEEVDKSLRKKEAHSRAVVLEMIGDIPDADITPPENVLFICKLNPVTQEDDLNTIFSRFGKIISADIIRDYKTGDSLCYGFIEFETKEACEAAYFKMDNVLIDDRRIHVDFSQSVARLWTRFRKFGAKDTNEHGPDALPAQRGKGGCFNCGEPGHLKKDCPNGPSGASGAAPNGKPRYTLKEPAGQRGSPRNRYEMVFDDNSDASGSDKHDGNSSRGNSRGYNSRSERSFRRSSKDDGNEKRARPCLSPREKNGDRSHQSVRDVRITDREATRVEERPRGREDDVGRRARPSPPPPAPPSRGRFDERGHHSGRDDRYRERGDPKRARPPAPPPPPASREKFDERGHHSGRDDRYRERGRDDMTSSGRDDRYRERGRDDMTSSGRDDRFRERGRDDTTSSGRDDRYRERGRDDMTSSGKDDRYRERGRDDMTSSGKDDRYRERGRDDRCRERGDLKRARPPPPPPPPSSRGKFDERGHHSGRDDKYQERGDPKKRRD